jgi:ppGpp synthetase/RelA/SpoT-type nucleotidyltranferase
MQGIIDKLVENLEDFNEVEERRRRVKISKTLKEKRIKKYVKIIDLRSISKR